MKIVARYVMIVESFGKVSTAGEMVIGGVGVFFR